MSENNQYIPKFIQDVPWYYNAKHGDDALSHHRKDPTQKNVDQSLPQAGVGINDEYTVTEQGEHISLVEDYDAKRDRWRGHTDEQWDEILRNWSSIKGNSLDTGAVDSDDTDYELELSELGLAKSDLVPGQAEDPMEKSIRDRRDIPSYIKAINSNAGGKIRLGKDSLAGLVGDDSDFQKESTDLSEFQKMQKFAWEQNKEYETKLQKKNYDNQLAQMSNPDKHIESLAAADLDSSLEASPTLMMLKNRQNEEKRRKAGEAKRQKLLERYG